MDFFKHSFYFSGANEESVPDVGTSQCEKEPVEDIQKPSTSRFGENQSTVVSRVPNKSVEDLYHADCVGCPSGASGLSPLPPSGLGTSHSSIDQDSVDYESETLESLGAYGGKVESAENQSTFSSESDKDLDDVRVEGKILKKLLNTDKIDIPYQEILPSGASGFGVIKDISFSNLHVGDSDKTKEFASKDLSGLSKPKQAPERPGNGRLFAANTPGEDEKIFSLLSPESDFSESSSSEVWGFRPLRQQQQPNQQQTPETDSSMDTCSCADTPNQNEHYMHGDSSSPVIGPNLDCSNLATDSKKTSSKDLSILEMTQNLVQMTRHMQDSFGLHEQKVSNTEESQNLPQDIPEPDFIDDTLPEPPSVGSHDLEGDIISDLIARTSFDDSSQEQIDSETLEVQDLEAETVYDTDIIGGGATISAANDTARGGASTEVANENSGEIPTVPGDTTVTATGFNAADIERSTYV